MQTINLILRTIMVVTGIAVASGCAASLGNNPDRPSVNSASIIQFNQELKIPYRQARIYIQDGVVARVRSSDEWSTFCSVLMQKRHETGEPRIIISPGQFKITKVIENNGYIGTHRTYIASLKWILDVAKDDNRRSNKAFFSVEMRLNSAQQPGVRSLICEKRTDNYGLYNYPTLAEIRIALGNMIEIKTR